MKAKKLLLFLFCAILGSGLVSCGSDDDDDNEDVATNTIAYGKVKTNVAGVLITETPYTLYSEYYVILYGEGISYNSSDQNSPNLIGDGVLLSIAIVSEDNTVEGTYNYGQLPGVGSVPVELKSTTIVDMFAQNYLARVKNGVVQEQSSILGMFMNNRTTVTITKGGDEYEIVMKGKDNAGDDVYAHYKGKVTKEVNDL